MSFLISNFGANLQRPSPCELRILGQLILNPGQNSSIAYIVEQCNDPIAVYSFVIWSSRSRLKNHDILPTLGSD